MTLSYVHRPFHTTKLFFCLFRMSSAKPRDVNTKRVKWRENLPKTDAQIGVPRTLPFFHRPGTEKAGFFN